MERCFKNPLDSSFESRGDGMDITAVSGTEAMLKLDEQKKFLHAFLEGDRSSCSLR